MTNNRRFLNALLFSLLLFTHIIPASNVQAAVEPVSIQQTTSVEKAQALLEDMSVEERVGQLFLIGFEGNDINETTQIHSLIENYHIGGVMLSAANDNFQPDENPLTEYAQLLDGLQTIEWESASANPDDSLNYIPLFIGVRQNGDGAPYDQILEGLTQVPSQMTIGATWNVNAAYQAGSILGEELSALGFNLFFGPSLDIYEDSDSWLGTRSFGSDPDWVGNMGQSYIRGLHQGSQNQIAVIAENFPGTGEADHSPNDEIVTILKDISNLKEIDLAPFWNVTGRADDASQAEGILVSHSRYQALQGAIRSTTRPISLDQEALNIALSMPEIADWRTNGGLVISDDLASTAGRKFFDPLNFTFDARQVTTSALSAGNDMLFIDGLVSPLNEENYLLLINALQFFAQKYQEDSVFAGHVDQAVLKILAAKFELYPSFALENTLSQDEESASIGGGSPLIFNIAQEAVTLISPAAEDLNSLLPNPPDARERIIFISDTFTARQCTRCETNFEFTERSLQDAVLRLYGPSGSGQVVTNRLSSFSFSAVNDFLDDDHQEQEHPIAEELALADWVVFSMLDVNGERASSVALKRLLDEEEGLLLDKNVVVFAFNDPTVLNATEIASLTAYYAVYSKGEEFIDVAARVLFKELPTTGALPVSFKYLGYDINVVTSPDPSQIIPLGVDQVTLAELAALVTPVVEPTSDPPPGEEEEIPTPVPTAPSEPTFKVDDVIPLLAGPVKDHNGNIVPDGTPVQFQAVLFGDTPGLTRVINTVTENGMARAIFPIQESGLMEISVVSELARVSSVLQIDVPEEGQAPVMEVSPQVPTEQAAQMSQPTITLEPTSTATPTLPTQAPDPVIPGQSAGEWIVAMAIAWISGAMVFLSLQRNHSVKWQARRGLLVVIISILGYIYLTIHLPGSVVLLETVGNFWSTLVASSAGGLLGFGIGWLWNHEFE
ncbi:MAG: hypothetical protein K8R40_02060 [Anaerolineaceae bacterium]|nr:hypothetical protein [Anaerolineaceae bacterium]